MGLHSGRFGLVDGISTMRVWSIQEQSAPPKAVGSNTKQGVIRREGVRSWQGSYGAYGAIPAVRPGHSFAFVGYGSPGNDVYGADGQRYSGTAFVNSVVINWNWATGEILSHVVNFMGHLELTKASGVAPLDATEPDVPAICGSVLKWAPGPGFSVFAELPNVVSAQLTMTVPVNKYVNSSTHVGGKCWTGQSVGAPFDWTLQINQEDENRITSIFDVDDDVALQLFVGDTVKWELTYGHVRDFTGIQVNRETGAIVKQTINIDMNAYYDGYGSVLDPNSDQWWPDDES